MTHLHAVRRPSLRVLLMLVTLAFLSLGEAPSWAQGQAAETAQERVRANPFGTGAGGQVLLTNNGFGLGGYYRHEVNASTSFLIEASLGAGKDDRERVSVEFSWRTPGEDAHFSIDVD